MTLGNPNVLYVKIKGKLIVDQRAERLFLNLESPWEEKILGKNSVKVGLAKRE